MQNVFKIIIAKRTLGSSALLYGCLLAALAPSSFIIFVMALASRWDAPLEWDMLKIVLKFYLSGVGASMVTLIIAGVPWILVLDRMNILNWLTVCCGAIVAGVVVSFAVEYIINNEIGLVESIGVYLMGATCGLISGAGFCIGAKFYSRSTLSSLEVCADQASVAEAKDA